MYLIPSTEISLFFNAIPKRTEACIPSRYEFKNSVALQLTLLNFQPFTNHHFPFLVIVESATFLSVASGPQNQSLHSCCLHIRTRNAGPNGAIIVDVRSTILKICAQFSDMLNSHYAINIHLYTLKKNFDGGKGFRP